MKFHPNAPPKLIKAYRKHRSYHKTADALEVNVKYVHQLITQGIEPTDRTETGREIRHRIFLPRYKRKKPSRPPQPKPEHHRWWSRQGREGRENIIRQTYELNKDRMP